MRVGRFGYKRLELPFAVLCVALAACSGGGGGSVPNATGTISPAQPTPTPGASSRSTPTPAGTGATSTPTPTAAPTAIGATPTPEPTKTPTPAPTAIGATPTPEPTKTPTPAPTAIGATPTPDPTKSPTPVPTKTPAPTPTPTKSPTPAPTPTPTQKPTASPSPTPAPGPTLAATLCIGLQLYTLGDHDNFATDTSLSVADAWPPSSTEWSNQFYFGRTDNPGVDLALYPSKAQMTALWPSLPPVAKLISGVGLDLHAEPVPLPTTAAQHTALCSNGGDTTCRTYLSGMLSNANVDTTGYWVYKVQLPPNNQATGASWWPAVWLFNNTPATGTSNEMDNEEQWPWTVIGTDVVQQTEQCYSPCTTGAIVGYRGDVATSESAMNTYGAIVTSNYNGFYINGVPSSIQMHKNSTGPLGPILTLQVNGAYGVTPAPGATADMIVASYAHYKATPLTACSGGLATPAP